MSGIMYLQIEADATGLAIQKLRVGQYKNREFDLSLGPVLKVPYNTGRKWVAVHDDMLNDPVTDKLEEKWFAVCAEIERMLPEFYVFEE